MILQKLIPNAEQVLAMAHAQLAHAILRAMHQEKRDQIRHGFARTSPNHGVSFHLQDVDYREYPESHRYEIGLAVGEAWEWMNRELILIPEDLQHPGFRRLSRIGLNFLEEGDPAPLHASRQIDRGSLHPSLRQEAIDNFWRGSYDVSIFVAFRAVEVAVRTAGGFPQTTIGAQLMADAFNTTSGPLRDTSIPAGEQVAMMQLFQGAIGLFKNPNSHRYVQNTPQSAAELLVLASHLLKIVDDRTTASSGA